MREKERNAVALKSCDQKKGVEKFKTYSNMYIYIWLRKSCKKVFVFKSQNVVCFTNERLDLAQLGFEIHHLTL